MAGQARPGLAEKCDVWDQTGAVASAFLRLSVEARPCGRN